MTLYTPSPNQSAAQTVLRSFLLAILPSGVECIEGQDNRTPEPQGSDFVVMTAIRRERIETNVDTYADCKFIGSVTGSTMNVSAVDFGRVIVGNQLFGAGVTTGTLITADNGGGGGVGAYTVSPPQNIGSQILASGFESILQPTRITYQLDVHSANVSDSADMAETISTLFRDDFATRFFKAANPNVSPLYADDPKQVPFLNAEQAWETRWIVEAQIQVNQTSAVPQQFADQLEVDLVDVDAEYPA